MNIHVHTYTYTFIITYANIIHTQNNKYSDSYVAYILTHIQA